MIISAWCSEFTELAARTDDDPEEEIFMEQFKHHVSQHKDGTYSVGVSIDQGYMTPDDFILLSELAKKYHVTAFKWSTPSRSTVRMVRSLPFLLTSKYWYTLSNSANSSSSSSPSASL